MSNDIIQKIQKLKKEKNAIILVHNYQLPEIQDIADILGDSLDLSRQARDTEKDLIVFCGVRFMAETAKILSPLKKVLLPVYNAGCPMADMASEDELKKFKDKNPDYKIVTYVNTKAEVKALSDICVTSANAVKVVFNYPYDKLLFVPDRNLGSFVKSKVQDKEIKLWQGYCDVHVKFNLDEVQANKEKHPGSELLVHPECEQEILNIADRVFSTNQMVKYIKESGKVFLIGTEEGIIYRLKKENPDKEIYPAGESIVCPDMKMTRLLDVLKALEHEQYEITLHEDIIKQSQIALKEMLKY